MRRILITGGAGFVGSHLQGRLEEQGAYQICSVDCRKKSSKDIELDLTNRDAVVAAVRDGTFSDGQDVVVHLASRLISAENPRDISVLHDNINMAENVAYIAEKSGARKIIHASTMAVYPNKTGTYTEESNPVVSKNSECLYGLSKICSEQILDFLTLQEPTDTVHLRFAQIYGSGMRNDRILSQLEAELKATNCITVYGNGERVSNFIPIESVVDAIAFFIQNDACGTFNIGGEQKSYLQLAEGIIERHGNQDSQIKLVPQGCREQVVLDCSKYQAWLKKGAITQ